MTMQPKPHIIGHEALFTYLENALKNGKIGQAILFVGPAHIGKKKLVNWLVQHENCQNEHPPCEECPGCISTRKGTNPDIYWISNDVATISVGEIRNLRSHMQKSPLSGDVVWGIIPDAERLTDEAANALLKELEEPKPVARFVLTTSNANRLLATIQSRCNIMHCQLVPEETLYQALVNVGVDRKKALTVTRFSQGRPGIAVQFLKNATFQGNILNIGKAFLKLLPSITPARASIFAEPLQETDPKTLVLAIQSVLRECLMASVGEDNQQHHLYDSELVETAVKSASPAVWGERLQAIETLEQEQLTPSKDQLIFERFFTKL